MKKNTFLLILLTSLTYAQKDSNQNKNSEKEDKDLKHEISHKSQKWFLGMKDGANYFDIKENYDKYFGNHKWEKSKPRSLGETWIKTKLFYLDKNGNVQTEPNLLKVEQFQVNSNYLSSNSPIGTWNFLAHLNSVFTSYSGSENYGDYVYLNRFKQTI